MSPIRIGILIVVFMWAAAGAEAAAPPLGASPPLGAAVDLRPKVVPTMRAAGARVNERIRTGAAILAR